MAAQKMLAQGLSQLGPWLGSGHTHTLSALQTAVPSVSAPRVRAAVERRFGAPPGHHYEAKWRHVECATARLSGARASPESLLEPSRRRQPPARYTAKSTSESSSLGMPRCSHRATARAATACAVASPASRAASSNVDVLVHELLKLLESSTLDQNAEARPLLPYPRSARHRTKGRALPPALPRPNHARSIRRAARSSRAGDE